MNRGTLPARPLSPEEFERYENDIPQFETVKQNNAYIAAEKALEASQYADEERAIQKAAGTLVLGTLVAKGIEEFTEGI